VNRKHAAQAVRARLGAGLSRKQRFNHPPLVGGIRINFETEFKRKSRSKLLIGNLRFHGVSVIFGARKMGRQTQLVFSERSFRQNGVLSPHNSVLDGSQTGP
jgi:hypothetical protein